MSVREVKWATILVDGMEHVLQAYDDDTGHGLALCGQAVCPVDIGPRFDEEVTCVECKEALRRRLERISDHR